MSKYILTIEGDFEKGECEKCPATYHLKGYCNGEAIAWEKFCLFGCDANTCPLEEVEQGEWILVHPLQDNDDGAYMCSCCKTGDWNYNKDWKYCPNCGAKMKGGAE